MILGLLVKAEFHWGYWIRVPFTSKAQPTLPLPPPTTLVGALASDLAKEGVLKDPTGRKVSGELFRVEIGGAKKRGKIDFRSPAALLDYALITASSALSEGMRAFIMDDLSRYVTLLFQEKIPEKAQGEKIPRRYLPKYRTGAIPCGKVYYPSGLIDVAYLFDLSRIEHVVHGDPVRALIEAAWNINRMGSKESMVIVRSVSHKELEDSEISKGKVRTRFYFPARAGSNVRGEYYTEIFWRGGWGRHDNPIFEQYLIPGSRNPITSSTIIVDAEAYVELDKEAIVFPAPGG